MSATTVVRPHRRWPVIVGVTAVAAIVATFAVLLIAGVFDDETTAPRSTAPVVNVVPTSGGVQQAQDQMNEHRLAHGAAAAVVVKSGDTKDDLGAVSPAAGRFLAKPQGDTKGDIPGQGAAGYEGGN